MESSAFDSIKAFEEIRKMIEALTTRIDGIELSLKFDRDSDIITSDDEIKNQKEDSSKTRHNNKNDSSEAEIPIKDLLLTIGEFEGDNVEAFIYQVENAYANCSENKKELLLARILGTKLRGKAKIDITSERIKSLNDLKQTLRLIYGSSNDITTHRIQRMNCRQSNKESVVEYGQRFMKIQDQAIKAILNKSDIPITVKIILTDEERSRCLIDYTEGLVQEIKIDVKAEKPENIPAAIQIASRAETILKSRQELGSSLRMNLGAQQKGRKYCNYCKKLEHIIKECKKRPPQNSPQSQEQYQQGKQNFRGTYNQDKGPPRVNHMEEQPPEESTEPITEKLNLLTFY